MSAYKRTSYNLGTIALHPCSRYEYASTYTIHTYTITPLNIKNQVINNDIILINIRGGKSIHANVLTFGAEKGMPWNIGIRERERERGRLEKKKVQRTTSKAKANARAGDEEQHLPTKYPKCN